MTAAMRMRCLWLVLPFICVSCPGSSGSGSGGLTVAFGPVNVFAAHADFAADGFAWGPPDGTLGVMANGGAYTFFGSAGSSATCKGSPMVQGAFRFTGSLDHLTGLPVSQCKALFTLGAAPAGWVKAAGARPWPIPAGRRGPRTSPSRPCGSGWRPR